MAAASCCFSPSPFPLPLSFLPSSLAPLHKNVPFNWRFTLRRHLFRAPRDSRLFGNVKELLMGQSRAGDALFTMFTDAKDHLAGRGRKEHTPAKALGDARISPCLAFLSSRFLSLLNFASLASPAPACSGLVIRGEFTLLKVYGRKNHPESTTICSLNLFAYAGRFHTLRKLQEMMLQCFF